MTIRDITLFFLPLFFLFLYLLYLCRITLSLSVIAKMHAFINSTAIPMFVSCVQSIQKVRHYSLLPSTTGRCACVCVDVCVCMSVCPYIQPSIHLCRSYVYLFIQTTKPCLNRQQFASSIRLWLSLFGCFIWPMKSMHVIQDFDWLNPRPCQPWSDGVKSMYVCWFVCL